MNASTENSNVFPESTNRFPMEKQVEIIMQPYKHIIQAPLPEIWNKLGRAFNGWLNISEDHLQKVEEALEEYQHSCVLFEDIEYERNVTHTIKSARSTYGVAHTLSTYLYTFTVCLKKLLAINSQLDKIIVEMVKKTCLSRRVQSFWSDTGSPPTEQKYYKMLVQKSYGLLTSRVKCMQVLSGSNVDLTKLAKLFSLYFEILDDYRRLKSCEDHNDDSYCEDLTWERFILAIAYTLKNRPEDGQVILSRRSQSKELHNYLVVLLKQSGSFPHIRTVLRQLRLQILNEIKKCGRNILMDKFLEENMSDLLSEEQFNENIILEFVKDMDTIESDEKWEVKEILSPYTYLKTGFSNVFRRELISFANTYLNVGEETLAEIENICAYLMEFLVLVDDIQDHSVLRRGIPVAHSVFGIANTINSVTYITALALETAVKLDKPMALQICLETVDSMCRGQTLDIYLRDNFICPTESEYLEIITQKTASFNLALVKLAELFSSANKSIVKLALTIGQFIQISEDYHNLTSQVCYDNKGFCEDLTEGKFGLPVIYAINASPDKGRIILDILRERTYDIKKKKYCLSLIQEYGGFDYTKSKIKEFQKIIENEITGLGGNLLDFKRFQKVVFSDGI